MHQFKVRRYDVKRSQINNTFNQIILVIGYNCYQIIVGMFTVFHYFNIVAININSYNVENL